MCSNLLTGVSDITGSSFFMAFFLLLGVIVSVKGAKRFHKSATVQTGSLFSHEETESESEPESAEGPWWKRNRKHATTSDDETDEEEIAVKKGDEAVTNLRHQTLHHVNQVRKGERVPMMDQNAWDDIADSSSDNESTSSSNKNSTSVHLGTVPTVDKSTPSLTSDEKRALAAAQNEDKDRYGYAASIPKTEPTPPSTSTGYSSSDGSASDSDSDSSIGDDSDSDGEDSSYDSSSGSSLSD